MATIHDIAHLVLPEVTKNVLRRTYAKILFECVRRKAKSIIFVSKFTEIEFINNIGKHMVKQILCTMESIAIGLKLTSIIAQCHGFIAVGNLKRHKRIDILCKAFASVQNIIKKQFNFGR